MILDMTRNAALDHDYKSTVCLLIINEIREFPSITIRSILQNSNSNILVGYINSQDIKDLPENHRIQYIDLSTDLNGIRIEHSEGYQGWDSHIFFQIIQLKWILLKKAFFLGNETVIYCDVDVIWLQDAEDFVRKASVTHPHTKMFIQSFTYFPDRPRLCMGFVYLINSPEVLSFIDEAEKRHKFEYLSNSKIGDDDIVTMLFEESDFPSWMRELPQSSFPVGNALNQYRSDSKMPGLFALRPIIFHATNVGGIRNKLLLVRIFLTKAERKNLKIRFSLDWIILLGLKKISYSLRKVQKLTR